MAVIFQFYYQTQARTENVFLTGIIILCVENISQLQINYEQKRDVIRGFVIPLVNRLL